jgi:hypothetical protein
MLNPINLLCNNIKNKFVRLTNIDRKELTIDNDNYTNVKVTKEFIFVSLSNLNYEFYQFNNLEICFKNNRKKELLCKH